jgi:Spy/CpxP family protein refolding chaperone
MSLRPITTLALFAALACPLVFAGDDAQPEKPNAGKGEAKGKGAKAPVRDAVLLKYALQHSADINLTDDQKEKLTKLKATIDDQQEKLKTDPEISSLREQMKEARKNDDKEKAREIAKQIKDLSETKGGDTLQNALKEAEGILTAEQTAKLRDLQKQEREKRQADHAEKKASAKENPAAPATPAPAANDKPADAPKTAEAPKTDAPKPDAAPADKGDNGMGK